MMLGRIQAWFADTSLRAGTRRGAEAPNDQETSRGSEASNDQDALPCYVLSYFDNLVSEYRTICLGTGTDLNDKQIALMKDWEPKVAECIDRRKKKKLTWLDIFELENLVLRLQPENRLRRRAWHLRSQFGAVFGPVQLAEYYSTQPPNPQTADEKDIRADVEQILSSFHWLYTVIPHREKIRDQLSNKILIMTIIGVVVALTVLFIEYIFPNSPKWRLGPLVMVLIMGMLGSCISMLRRLQTIPNAGDPIVNMEILKNTRATVILSPLTGAIFAALVYLMCLGGLLQGAVFPEKISLTTPVTGKDLGLLLIWAFVAGFAERFVPDALDRMAGQYEDGATARAAAQVAIAARGGGDNLGAPAVARDGRANGTPGGQDKVGDANGPAPATGVGAQGPSPERT